MTRGERRAQLDAHRITLRNYLEVKIYEEDWHAVQDAASDLRDVESELKGLDYE